MPYSANSTINNLENKTTPVDADVLVVGDSADTNRAKKTTWANIKATLKAYFDTIYSTIASPTFTGTVTTPAIVLSSETASTIASLDASKNVKSLDTATYPSLVELAYVKGVTSAIQTQLNAKAATLSGTNNEIAYFNSTSTIGSLAVATYPSLTELSYVKGATSSLQTQINALSSLNLQQQIVHVPQGETTMSISVYATTSYLGASTSNAVFTLASGSAGGSAATLSRFIKLSNGSLVLTHTTTTGQADGGMGGVAVVGNYVYALVASGGSPQLNRFDIADLANATTMTISGTALTVSTNIFSDGTNLYNTYTAGSAKIYTISGTTATSGADTAYTSMTTQRAHWSDGTYVYATEPGVAYRWALAGGARTSATQNPSNTQFILSGAIQDNGGGIFKEVGNTTHIHTIFANKTRIGGSVIARLVPITTF